MAITIKPAPVVHVLQHPVLSISYHFRKQSEDTVQVTHITARTCETYMVPAQEARGLYRDLLTKGYGRF